MKGIFRNMELLRNAMDAVSPAIIVVDSDLRVQFGNKAALTMAVNGRLGQKLGEMLGCPHSAHGADVCGTMLECVGCEVRRLVISASGEMTRKRERVLLPRDPSGGAGRLPAVITAAPFSFKGTALCLICIDDISELAQLRTLLPICASCKKIRTGEDYWEHVEEYINTHLADIKFTHGVCPECTKKLYPELSIAIKGGNAGSPESKGRVRPERGE